MALLVRRGVLLVAVLSAMQVQAEQMPDETAESTTLSTVVVTSSVGATTSEQTMAYIVKDTASATKLDIAAKETPQTINVVTRQQIDDFSLTSTRDVLSNTPGVTVQATETDRSVYTARGFEISNILVDGVGFPSSEWNYNDTDPDTYFYDRVEVVKGADALMNAFGDPSATINYIRKRPTEEQHGNAGISYGSWDTQRYEGDVSGALTADGRIRGRLMGYEQTGNYYLDNYSLEKNGIAGILEADLTDSTLLTVGYSQANHKPNGNNWGALPLLDANGRQLSYSRSYNPSPDWAYWDNESQNAFLELQQQLNDNWKLRVTYNYDQKDRLSHLLYYYGYPTTAGADAGIWPGGYIERQYKNSADINLAGTFDAFGQQHELVAGYSYVKNKEYNAESWATTFNSAGQPYAMTTSWADWTPAYAIWSPFSKAADYKQTIDSVYAATRLHLDDDWRLILGANYIQADSRGDSYGDPMVYDESKVAPYVGITYNFTPEYTGYVSYTSIFRPQTSIDAATGKAASPIDGDSYETGIKSAWLDGKLTGTLAVFRTTESNYPLRSSDGNPRNHKVEVSDLRSQGVEVSLSGQLTDDVNISAGYAQFTLKDLKNGGEARTYNPDKTFNLLATYTPPALPKLKVGAGVQWQNKISRYDPDYNNSIRQGSYALLNLMASYDINDSLSVQANANNVGDKKYLNSFNDGQAYYGAPANYTVSFKFKY